MNNTACVVAKFKVGGEEIAHSVELRRTGNKVGVSAYAAAVASNNGEVTKLPSPQKAKGLISAKDDCMLKSDRYLFVYQIVMLK